jgi:hypothetical protein
MTPLIRLAIGLLQGVALLMLYQASEQKTWPATDAFVFAPLATIATFVPLIVISALGHVRWRALLAWAVVATLLCAGLAIYDIFRNSDAIAGDAAVTTDLMHVLPSWVMWWSLASILFIVHTLTVAGEADRKLIASYPTHFDIAWKHGAQFVLAQGFVGLFWGLLFLGAELFRLIRIEFLAELIERPKFSIPVAALAFSYAIHVTDVRANIVQGARTLALILLSWLLPLMALLGAAFVVALLFTGLAPLWSTRRATSILLVAAAALIFLVNAAYQDGRAETRAVAILRYASRLAALVLVPLVALAAYGVGLRIAQYGWTPERITALACDIVAACYGLGYFAAALRWTNSAWLEPTNIFTSMIIVGVLLALSTPVADPARISVADQLSRLRAGTEKPEHFDFGFLRFRAGRYGVQALEQLAARTEGPQASIIAERANQALHARNIWEIGRAASQPPTTPAERGLRITVVFPNGATLPEGFVQQDWNAIQLRWKLPNCLVSDIRCDAILTDLDGDGQPEILLLNRPTGVAAAFKKGLADTSWIYLGAVTNADCFGVRNALLAGQFETAQPAFKDIIANGQRLFISTDCAQAPSR